MTIEMHRRHAGIRTLRKKLIGLLWLTFVLAAGSLGLEYIERGVLQGIKDLSFPSNEEMIAAAEASDRYMFAAGIAQFVTFLACTLAWFIWIYRCNRLARSLGAEMQHSPGWSVGWFFVPIANLFKPYFVMRENLFGTLNPKAIGGNFVPESRGGTITVLKLWWLLYLADRFVNSASTRVAFGSQTIDQLIYSNSFKAAADIATIVSSLMTIWLVKVQSRAQDDAAGAIAREPSDQTQTISV